VFHEKLACSGNALDALSDWPTRSQQCCRAGSEFFHGKQLSPDDLKGEQDSYRKKVRLAAGGCAKADLLTEVVGEFPSCKG